MSIGADIKEVYQDVGVAYTVLRDGGNVTGEYLDYDSNAQVTKPFIREFFLEASVAYDTAVVLGDVLRITASSDVYMVMNKTPEIFENEVISYNAVLYKCNVSGEITRLSGEGWDANYKANLVWQTVKSGAYGLQTEALYGHDMETDEQLGLIGMENHELYLPHSYGMQVHDRWEPVSGEYYRAETRKTRRYPAVDVFEVAQDTR